MFLHQHHIMALPSWPVACQGCCAARLLVAHNLRTQICMQCSRARRHVNHCCTCKCLCVADISTRSLHTNVVNNAPHPHPKTATPTQNVIRDTQLTTQTVCSFHAVTVTRCSSLPAAYLSVYNNAQQAPDRSMKQHQEHTQPGLLWRTMTRFVHDAHPRSAQTHVVGLQTLGPMI